MSLGTEDTALTQGTGSEDTAGVLTKAFLQVVPENIITPISWLKLIQDLDKSTPESFVPQVRCSYTVRGTDDVKIFPKTSQQSVHRSLLIGSRAETQRVASHLSYCQDFRYDSGPDYARVLDGLDGFEESRRIPTKANIEASFTWLTDNTIPGDVVFVYYAGPFGNRGEHGYLTPWMPDERIDSHFVQNKLLLPLKNTGGVVLRVLLDAPNCGGLFELPGRHHHQMTLKGFEEDRKHQRAILFDQFKQGYGKLVIIMGGLFAALCSLNLILGEIDGLLTSSGSIVGQIKGWFN